MYGHELRFCASDVGFGLAFSNLPGRGRIPGSSLGPYCSRMEEGF